MLLYSILRLRTGGRRALVFVNTIDKGYKLKLFLDAFGVRNAVLNSELPSASRSHILSGYNRGVFDTLIATDEALIDNEEIPDGMWFGRFSVLVFLLLSFPLHRMFCG